MKTQEITTNDLSKFGYMELQKLVALLDAMHNQGLPDNFYQEDVIPMLNKRSGYVFLTNSEYQCAMMNGGSLEIWNLCPNCGHEGFEEDCQLNEDGCNECKSKEESQ